MVHDATLKWLSSCWNHRKLMTQNSESPIKRLCFRKWSWSSCRQIWIMQHDSCYIIPFKNSLSNKKKYLTNYFIRFSNDKNMTYKNKFMIYCVAFNHDAWFMFVYTNFTQLDFLKHNRLIGYNGIQNRLQKIYHTFSTWVVVSVSYICNVNLGQQVAGPFLECI